MPGRKRKATASADDQDHPNKMWGSSASSGHSSRRNRGSSSRRGNPESARSSTIDEAAASKILKIFEGIADEDDPNVAGLEGISKLCEDLDIDAEEDIRVLVLMWKLGSSRKPAEISKDEWMQGCSRLNLTSIQKFKELLPGLDTGFLDNEEFKDFYKFVFQFSRSGTHKTLDKDLVVGLMKLCLGGGRINAERLDTFCEFLETTKDEGYSKITLDQWRSFLDFSYEVTDLASYDESSSAWPVLIDEYVEFMEKKTKK